MKQAKLLFLLIAALAFASCRPTAQQTAADAEQPTDITYQLAGSAEQRPLGFPMGDACSARTSMAFKPPRFQESAMKLEDSGIRRLSCRII